eukprot:2003775-Pleurochrysis_carterae.AAC.1
MYWASVDGDYEADWHIGVVFKVLRPNRRDGFTNDARLNGSDGIRGVKLDTASHYEGFWFFLRANRRGGARPTKIMRLK